MSRKELEVEEKCAKHGNMRVMEFREVSSTSTVAREYAAQGKATPALFCAQSQTSGRGRLGRSFFSPEGTGIYQTLLIDVTSDEPASLVCITSAAAVAVARACERAACADCKIKWVNDIYVGGKKVCGILAEGFSANGRRFLSIGVGVNVCTMDFPDDIKDTAGSLTSGERGLEDSQIKKRLSLDIADGLLAMYEALRRGDRSHMAEYRERSLVLGREITFIQNGVSETGTVQAIDDNGALVVILPDGAQKILASGEISVRLK